MWINQNRHTLLVGLQNSVTTLENNLAILQKVKHRVTIWPCSSTPRHLLKRIKSMCPTKTRNTWVFIAALFMMAPKWKQPKCLSSDEWLNKLWSVHTMEYYLAIKRNGVLTLCYSMDEPWKHYSNWSKQDTKATCCMTPLIWNIQKRQIHTDRK